MANAKDPQPIGSHKVAEFSNLGYVLHIVPRILHYVGVWGGSIELSCVSRDLRASVKYARQALTPRTLHVDRHELEPSFTAQCAALNLGAVDSLSFSTSASLVANGDASPLLAALCAAGAPIREVGFAALTPRTLAFAAAVVRRYASTISTLRMMVTQYDDADSTAGAVATLVSAVSVLPQLEALEVTDSGTADATHLADLLRSLVYQRVAGRSPRLSATGSPRHREGERASLMDYTPLPLPRSRLLRPITSLTLTASISTAAVVCAVLRRASTSLLALELQAAPLISGATLGSTSPAMVAAIAECTRLQRLRLVGGFDGIDVSDVFLALSALEELDVEAVDGLLVALYSCRSLTHLTIGRGSACAPAPPSGWFALDAARTAARRCIAAQGHASAYATASYDPPSTPTPGRGETSTSTRQTATLPRSASWPRGTMPSAASQQPPLSRLRHLHVCFEADEEEDDEEGEGDEAWGSPGSPPPQVSAAWTASRRGTASTSPRLAVSPYSLSGLGGPPLMRARSSPRLGGGLVTASTGMASPPPPFALAPQRRDSAAAPASYFGMALRELIPAARATLRVMELWGFDEYDGERVVDALLLDNHRTAPLSPTLTGCARTALAVASAAPSQRAPSRAASTPALELLTWMPLKGAPMLMPQCEAATAAVARWVSAAPALQTLELCAGAFCSGQALALEAIRRAAAPRWMSPSRSCNFNNEGIASTHQVEAGTASREAVSWSAPPRVWFVVGEGRLDSDVRDALQAARAALRARSAGALDVPPLPLWLAQYDMLRYFRVYARTMDASAS